jgi:hypothetical protein
MFFHPPSLHLAIFFMKKLMCYNLRFIQIMGVVNQNCTRQCYCDRIL